MAKTVLIIGPAGCGKTLHAEALRQHFGCDTVHDNWQPSHGTITGALMLTNMIPGGALPYTGPLFDAYEFNDAMRRMNEAHAQVLAL